MIRNELLLERYSFYVSKINDQGKLIGTYIKANHLRVDNLFAEKEEYVDLIKEFENIIAVLGNGSYLKICFDYDKMGYAASIERLKGRGPYGEDVYPEVEFHAFNSSGDGLLKKLNEVIKVKKLEELKSSVLELGALEINTLIEHANVLMKARRK